MRQPGSQRSGAQEPNLPTLGLPRPAAAWVLPRARRRVRHLV